MLLEAMTAQNIEIREPELLALACKHMPKLCVDKLDVCFNLSMKILKMENENSLIEK